jgi:hypothetical protein
MLILFLAGKQGQAQISLHAIVKHSLHAVKLNAVRPFSKLIRARPPTNTSTKQVFTNWPASYTGRLLELDCSKT